MLRRVVVLAATLGSLAGIAIAAVVVAQSSPSPPASDGRGNLNAAAVTAPVRTTQTTVARGVAPLRRLAQPDLFVATRRTLTVVELSALTKRARARGSTVLDIGTVRIGGHLVRVAGVDPAQFRGFTPPPTAASDELWNNLARGDLIASYDLARKLRLTLGTPVTVAGSRVQVQRVGAFAAVGIPVVDVIVSRVTAAALGIRPRSGVVLSAPGRTAKAMTAAARDALGRHARILTLREDDSTYTGKPRTYRELYQAAARTCPGLSWRILAAIGQVESDHGVNVGPSTAGALGPMQFMPGTWAAWARDGDGDRKADIMNPYDAVYAAAAYLCHNGAGRGGTDLERAIFAYNHADWYVKEVLALARLYR